MKKTVEVAASAGPCWGVERAINTALGIHAKLQKNGGGKMAAFGELVHNPNSIQHLRDVGISEIGSVSEAEGKHVFVTAHGIDPVQLAELKSVSLSTEDTTCPIVQLLHEKALGLKTQGRRMVLIGRSKEHPEVKGTIGVLGGQVRLIGDEPQVQDLLRHYDADDPIGVIAQTTFSRLKVISIIEVMKLHFKNVVYEETTCSDVTSKLLEVMERAVNYDLTIVLSGENSENGRTIMETAKLSGRKVLFILDQRAIRWETVQNMNKILITTAASTLQPDIDAALKKLKGWGWKEVKPKGPALSKEDRARNAARQAAGKPPLF